MIEFVDNNPYASPRTVESPAEKAPRWGLGLSSLASSMTALLILVLIATQDHLVLGPAGDLIVTWALADIWRWYGFAGFAWLMSLVAIIGGQHAIADTLQHIRSKQLAALGIAIGSLNLILSVGYLAIRIGD